MEFPGSKRDVDSFRGGIFLIFMRDFNMFGYLNKTAEFKTSFEFLSF